MASPFVLTADGYESQWAVNHLAHFLLTNTLLPVLKRTGTSHEPARVVCLSSSYHALAKAGIPVNSGASLDFSRLFGMSLMIRLSEIT